MLISTAGLVQGGTYTVTAGTESQTVTLSSLVYGSGMGMMGGFGQMGRGQGGFGGQMGHGQGGFGGRVDFGGDGQQPSEMPEGQQPGGFGAPGPMGGFGNQQG